MLTLFWKAYTRLLVRSIAQFLRDYEQEPAAYSLFQSLDIARRANKRTPSNSGRRKLDPGGASTNTGLPLTSPGSAPQASLYGQKSQAQHGTSSENSSADHGSQPPSHGTPDTP